MAGRQAGCFTRSQARADGFGDYRQRLLLASGRWRPLVGSVLVPADLEITPWTRAHAAVLASGRYRAASHSTAAALWGWTIDERFHVIRSSGRTHPDVIEHRLPLASGDVVLAAGIRITSLVRTLQDVMTGFEQRPAVAALADGFRVGLFTPHDVASVAAGLRHRTGAPQARELAHSCRGGPFSILEFDFHQVAWSIDPDGWRFNVSIRDAEGLIGYVDALHEPTRTVIEVDGRAYHADTFEADRTRDQRLAALGILCTRVTRTHLETPLLTRHRIERILASRGLGERAGRGSFNSAELLARPTSGLFSSNGLIESGPDRGWADRDGARFRRGRAG